MSDFLTSIKWFLITVAAFLLANWMYMFVVALTFAFSTLYNRQYNEKPLSKWDYVKLLMIGGLISISIFDALESQITGNSARVGVAAFLAALAIELSPITIQTAKEILPRLMKKKAGVKND